MDRLIKCSLLMLECEEHLGKQGNSTSATYRLQESLSFTYEGSIIKCYHAILYISETS
jgi:hypothetical protein